MTGCLSVMRSVLSDLVSGFRFKLQAQPNNSGRSGSIANFYVTTRLGFAFSHLIRDAFLWFDV